MGTISRRCFIAGSLVLAAVPPVLAGARTLSSTQAHAAALRGEILLLDIRTRREWHETGIGASAQPVSMHESDFLARVDRLTGGDMGYPIALICATGGRSNALQGILTRMGYKNILDVSEGMLGSRAGRGWIKAGLPVTPYRP